MVAVGQGALKNLVVAETRAPQPEQGRHFMKVAPFPTQSWPTVRLRATAAESCVDSARQVQIIVSPPSATARTISTRSIRGAHAGAIGAASK